MPEVPVNKVSWPTPRAFALDVVRGLQSLGLTFKSSKLLCAHLALSTGWGRHADNFRLAGIKCTDPATQDYTVPRGGFEYKNGVKVAVPGMKFRSYPTLRAGLKAVLGLLSARMYAPAKSLLLAGDPEYFAEVGRNGWYTAPVAKTSAEMRACLAAIEKMSLPEGTT